MQAAGLPGNPGGGGPPNNRWSLGVHPTAKSNDVRRAKEYAKVRNTYANRKQFWEEQVDQNGNWHYMQE